jgi:UDP-N-acetylmuramyl pentapeptide phosphotransferase/UDP-N-acetylglucosamine-1-phosphate transferase
MWLTIFSFATSAIITGLVVRYQHLHNHVSGDHDFNGPQKVHTVITPRIGGAAIMMGMLITTLYQYIVHPNIGTTLALVLIASLPVFIAGVAEDLTKRVGVKMRLLAGFIAGLLFLWLFDITTIRFGFDVLNMWLNHPWFVVFFLAFGITGLSNAYNIIDGFNGLASMVAIITCIGIAYVASEVNDPLVMYLAFIIIGAIAGFFLWNYPKGLIFLGDGGAYLIGYVIAVISILLVTRQPEISPWFALLINAYPIKETLFTIYRRKLHQGKNPSLADATHFHTLIYKRILNSKNQRNTSHWITRNARTAPYLWVLNGVAIIPAVIWWNSTEILVIFTICFSLFYIYLYRSIVYFKIPCWLRKL